MPNNVQYRGMKQRQIKRLLQSALLQADDRITPSDSETVHWRPLADGNGYLCLIVWERKLEKRHRYGRVGRCELQVILRLPRKDAELACQAVNMLDCELALNRINAQQFEYVPEPSDSCRWGETFSYKSSVRDGDDVVRVRVQCTTEH